MLLNSIYYKERPGYMSDLSRYNILYVDGKYLNGYRKLDMNLYSDVVFDDDVMYKTWWDTHPNSWYPESHTLTFVEADDSNEGKDTKYRCREIEEMVKRLTKEKNELLKAEKTPKYLLSND